MTGLTREQTQGRSIQRMLVRGRGARLELATIAAAGVCLMAGMEGCGGKNKAKASEAKTSAATGVQGGVTPSQMAISTSYVSSAEQAVRDGDLAKALAEFQRAIEVNPNLTSAHLGMGDIYRMKGDYASAEVQYGISARQEPRNFDAQYYHGLMLHLLDRLTEAVQAYLRALAVRPNDFRANLNLATAYYQLDENTQSLPYARKAVELNPDDGAARFNLGAVYAALGRHGDAVREYQQAAELMKLSPPLLINLAESLGKLERYDEMANTLAQAIKTEPSATAYERLGFARFRLGQYDEARDAFQAALRMDANYYPALNGLGVCQLNDWIRSGRADATAKEAGLGNLRKSLQIQRDQPQILEIVTRYGR